MSPILFALYVNDIIMKLEDSKLACYVGDTYTGCNVYADDIVLIAASVTMLQKMIDVVAEEASNIDMTLMLANQLLFVLARIISMHVFHYSC